MRTSQNGIELIKHFEGFSSAAYLCPANYLTIGYGHVISDGEKEKFLNNGQLQITKQQAEKLLTEDLMGFELVVAKLINVTLNQNQVDALVSFTFNLGEGALQRSTLRQKINRMEYDLAAYEFVRWIYAGGKKLPGLVLRRNTESALFSA